MTLHVINKTDAALWQQLPDAVVTGDAVLLIEDAVYAALTANPLAAVPLARLAGVHWHVLADDLAARGISAKIRPDFVSATFGDFVTLSINHERVVNWH